MSKKEEILYNENKNTNSQVEEEKSSENEPTAKKKNIGIEILKFLIYIVVIFLITFFILHFLGQRTRVSGSSMEATLSDGDNLIVDKLTYRFSDPERFDIIVFPHETQGEKSSFFNRTYYIKRIIGLPGETVYIDHSGNIFINGVKLEENYGLQLIIRESRHSRYTLVRTNILCWEIIVIIQAIPGSPVSVILTGTR